MKLYLFLISISLSSNVVAKELVCPEGTIKEPKPFVAGKRYSEFCYKDSEPQRRIKHGPYQEWENLREFGGQYELVLSGQYTDGKPSGFFEEYFPNGKVKAQFELDNDLKKMHGKFKRFHPDGSLRSEGQFDNDNGIGLWKFYSPEGKLLNSGTYEENQAVAKKFDEAELAKEKKATKEKEDHVRKSQTAYEKELKNNWSEKTVAGTKQFTSKKTKKTWSGFLGSGNHINAKRKCRAANMSLPNMEQLQAALEQGLSNFIENPFGLFWTSSDKGTVNEPQLSMILENGEAFAVSMDGQAVPQSILEDLGVVCVK